jgi:hypothetical protein
MLAQITNSAVIPDSIRLIRDLWPSLSIQDCINLIGAIFILARVLRKAVPDSMQTGSLGTILKHTALEINPQTNVEVPPAQSPKGASQN